MHATTTRKLKTKATAPLTEDQRRLAADHVGLIEPIAKNTARVLMCIEDRLSAGAMGLIDAAATYEPEAGASFPTWATLRIRSAILDAARAGDGSFIRVGRKEASKLSKGEFLRAAHPYSLDYAYHVEGFSRDTSLGATFVVAREEPPVDREMVRMAARTLGLRTAVVLAMYFGCGWSKKVIGGRLGISESRVSQITSDALAQLRDNPRIREAMAS